MKTLIAALVVSGFTVVVSAQTNTDPVPVQAPISTNAVLAATTNPPSPLQNVTTVPATHDFRVVAGVRVDLGPIHDYEQHPTGDRPLKHWKKITFQTIGPPVVGQRTCKIKVEGGGEMTVIVKNVPDPLAEAYAKATRFAEEHQRLTEQIGQDANRTLEKIKTIQESADLEPIPSTRANEVKATSTRLQDAAREQARLDQAASEEGKRFAAMATDYAMFTGRKAGNLGIWDCGIKAR